MSNINFSNDSIIGPQIDITKPDHGVEIKIKSDGKVLWVNVDGVCRLRVCMIEKLDLDLDLEQWLNPREIT